MDVKWTTVVQVYIDGEWEFFSQQSTKPSETEMSDAEYLEACRKAFPNSNLRLEPEARQ